VKPYHYWPECNSGMLGIDGTMNDRALFRAD